MDTEIRPARWRAAPTPVQADLRLDEDVVRYSICTLVTAPDQYRSMEASFRTAGFTGEDVEFLWLDNVGANRFDAYAGINLFLRAARGQFVILCHQDILLAFDDREVLDRRIAEIGDRDPAWAVLGNAGGVAPGRLALHITDPHGADRRLGELPCRVTALDEDFILVRRQANLGLPRDLAGFHFYGAALCLAAEALGYSSWAVDFHLRHLSGGVAGRDFRLGRAALIDHYRRAWRPRWVTTPSGSIYLTGSSLAAALLNTRLLAGARRRLGSVDASRRPL
jgi:hypothetical protein